MANCGNPACRKCPTPPRCGKGPRCPKCFPEKYRGKQPMTKYESDLKRTQKQVVKK